LFWFRLLKIAFIQDPFWSVGSEILMIAFGLGSNGRKEGVAAMKLKLQGMLTNLSG
jgi:hypothetical protein